MSVNRGSLQFDAGRSPRVLLTVVVGLNTVEHLCETLAGTPLPSGELVPVLTRSHVERIVFDGPDRIVSVSPQRSFTGALRRAIMVRDGECTHRSGCDVPAERCDIDHLVEHRNGGPTSQHNGAVRCAGHDRNEARRAREPAPGSARRRRPPRGWIPDVRAPRSGPSDDDPSDRST